jgi:hypothetical protein
MFDNIGVVLYTESGYIKKVQMSNIAPLTLANESKVVKYCLGIYVANFFKV